MAERQTKFPGIESLTMNDIVAWAGHTIASRGQAYQRDGLVENIAIAEDGTLLADVRGSERYSVMVTVADEGLPRSFCSCPYALDCKHGVAALLEYIERLNSGRAIQTATPDDPRLRLREYDADSESCPRQPSRKTAATGSAPMEKEVAENTALEGYLAGLSKKQLLSKLLYLSKNIPQVQSRLRGEALDRRADPAALLTSLRKEIHRVSRIDAWSDPWSGRGNIPDYSGVRRQMRALLEAGNPDGLLAEGMEFLRLGRDQIERSNDEGETCEEIAACVPLLHEALRGSALPAADKILWALEAVLADDFGVCDSLNAILGEPHPSEAWNRTANNLAAKLKEQPASRSDLRAQGLRNAISDWLIHALERSGREDEILPLCEAEARAVGNYKRLVARLMLAGKDAEALQWIHEGIRDTESNAYGRARALRDCRREIHTRQGDWQSLLLLEIEEFMHRPDAKRFARCRAVVQANTVWPEVRQTLLDFLISGGLPWRHPAWPSGVRKPQVGADGERAKSGFPMLSALINIAILEKIPEDVSRWHAMLPETYDGNSFHDNAALAMQEKFPEQSIIIWKRLAENCIARTAKNAYMEAGRYLHKIQKRLHIQGLQTEWLHYAAALRKQHSRKKKFP
ncbi:MAG: SWIM zinc finger family protein [Deltaproteobacteria bacterium]|jgi:uncharacterized Zn finger protein|nr:SWIM zinc finger family protein [Deltaproteobacteria bacterium]